MEALDFWKTDWLLYVRPVKLFVSENYYLFENSNIFDPRFF
jgi:hypothetical protein